MRPSRLAPPVLLLLSLAACAAPVAPEDDVGAAWGELVVCGRGPTVEGIDVSYWQGTIDWAAVAGDGIRFAIVRIGDGTYRDPQFARNWSEAKAHGLLRGAYQYFRPQTDPLVQADIVVEAVGRLGPGDMPVTVDVEAPDPGVSPATYTARLHQWIDRVTAGTGRAPIIYTGRYYWDPYVASSDFVDLPLWHAQYTTASCPNINDRWSSWAFWQYTSSGRVAGIAGNVDRNRWNGTYEELAAFAASNRKPRGYLDAATCEGLRGWAQDPDAPEASIDVHVYVGGPAGAPGAVGFPLHAATPRDDLCSAIGSCAHGFSMPLPLSFFDGEDHEVWAYGIDASGGENAVLGGAPQTIRCAQAPFPTPATGLVRRHVPSPEALAAWHLGAMDVAPVMDGMLDAVPDGPSLADAPALVRVDREDAVYVREGSVLRHVASPAVMDAWGFAFADVSVVGADALEGTMVGAPWPETPFLAQGDGPAVYVLDAPPPLWAELVSEDVPARLAAGAASAVTLRFKNRGSVAWAAGEVALAPTPRDESSELCDPSWPSCDRAATFDADVAPGEEGSLSVRLRAPLEEGPLRLCLGLVAGAHWFSDADQNGPADDALCWDLEVVPADAASLPGGGGADAPGPDGALDAREGGLAAGCSAAPGAPGESAPGLAGLALLGAAMLGRRRRR